jgi:hypothetical protein
MGVPVIPCDHPAQELLPAKLHAERTDFVSDDLVLRPGLTTDRLIATPWLQTMERTPVNPVPIPLP